MRTFILSITILLLTASHVTAQSSFDLVPFLPEATGGVASKISGDGSTIVGSSAKNPLDPTGGRAYMWKNGTMTELLPQFENSYSGAIGVSHDGSVIVGYDSKRGSFIWNQGEVTFFPGKNIIDVSDDGTTIIALTNAKHYLRIRGTDSLVIGDQSTIQLTGLSGDGSVLIGKIDNQEAFRWTEAGGIERLGFMNGSFTITQPNDISKDGKVIVGEGRANTIREPFRWTAETGMQPLGDFPDDAKITALSVSADGSVIVGEAGNLERPMIWTVAKGFSLLKDYLAAEGVNVGDVELQAAESVSDDGTIMVGNVRPSDSKWHGYRATIKPQPSSTVAEALVANSLSISLSEHPIRESATVSVQHSHASNMSADLYDMLGRRVILLHAGEVMGDRTILQLDASSLLSGTYLLCIKTDGNVLQERMIVTR